jgi:hypothetical protein
MKKLAIILILLTFTMINAIAQEANPSIENRFVGGDEAFFMWIYSNISYPESSKKNGSYGCSIAKFFITPTGEILDVKIINPVDKYIDTEVINLLLSTKGKWTKCDTLKNDQEFYIQIDFLFSGLSTSSFTPRSKPYSSLFLNPIIVTGKAVNKPKNKILDDQTLAAAGTSAIKEERYDEAIEIFNELIKRHPFTKEFYQLRMLVHKKLGHTDLVNQDVNTINNFAEGYSLDEIVGIN